jgi:prepilin-type N-terminal cleavage/methylation domain-containing protein
MGKTQEKRGTKGFTLLETMIALTVLLSAIVGPVALVTRGIYNFSFAKNRIIAVNLAQEGVELARTIRDNNILCDEVNDNENQTWNANPTGGVLNGEHTLDAFDVVLMNCKPPGLGPDILIPTPFPKGGVATPLTIDGNGRYTYGASTPTIFSRRIKFCSPPDSPTCSDPGNPICITEPGNPLCSAPSPDSDIPKEDQMEIISIVTWQEKSGGIGNVTLRERLYNWR